MNKNDKTSEILKLLSSFKLVKGRVNRTDYLIVHLLCIVLGFFGTLYLIRLGLSFVLYVPVVYAVLAVITCNRFRDIGLSGWWVMPYCSSLVAVNFLTEKGLISGVGLSVLDSLGTILLISLHLWPGTKGENKYGEYFEVFPNPLREIIGTRIKFFS